MEEEVPTDLDDEDDVPIEGETIYLFNYLEFKLVVFPNKPFQVHYHN
jgi:hypothetical protein